MSKDKLSLELKKFASYQRQIFFSKTDVAQDKDKGKKDFEAVNQICIRKYGRKPSGIFECPRSTFHRVYKFFVNDQAYIIRLSSLKFSGIEFLKEKFIYEALEREKLQKVSVYKTDFSRGQYPFDYQILECVSGETLFDISQKRKIPSGSLFQLGKFLARLHTISADKFGPINMTKLLEEGKPEGIYKNWSSYLECNLEKHLKYCINAKIINKETYSRIKKILKNERMTNFASTLLHGDLANHNVFVEKNKVTGLIDWEDALVGDPVFDIAYFGTGSFNHQEWLDEFLKGYKSFCKLPLDFFFRYWIYYLRISLSKAVLRHKSGKKDKDFLSGRIMKALSYFA